MLFRSPQEGVIVLESPELLKDSGAKIKVDSFMDHDVPEIVDVQPQEAQVVPDFGEVEVAVTPTKSTKKSRKNLMIDTLDISLTSDVELK